MAHCCCPDSRCEYTTQNPKQMERHITATKHGQTKKAFKGHLAGQYKNNQDKK